MAARTYQEVTRTTRRDGGSLGPWSWRTSRPNASALDAWEQSFTVVGSGAYLAMVLIQDVSV